MCVCVFSDAEHTLHVFCECGRRRWACHPARCPAVLGTVLRQRVLQPVLGQVRLQPWVRYVEAAVMDAVIDIQGDAVLTKVPSV
jgi:hypothetical protein